MPCDLYRDALRDAGADEIPDRGSAEVVQDTSRASSFRISSLLLWLEPRALGQQTEAMVDPRRRNRPVADHEAFPGDRSGKEVSKRVHPHTSLGRPPHDSVHVDAVVVDSGKVRQNDQRRHTSFSCGPAGRSDDSSTDEPPFYGLNGSPRTHDEAPRPGETADFASCFWPNVDIDRLIDSDRTTVAESCPRRTWQ